VGVAQSDNTVELVARTSDGDRTLRGSHLLVADGRVPNSDTLNPAAGGIETDQRGYVPANDKLETNVPGVYALGDVNGGPAFTHISYDDYTIVKRNLLGSGGASRAGRLVPYVVYIDPQLGRVGLSEQDAKAQSRPYRVAKMPMADVSRAIETDETRGFIKVLVDPDTKQLLGAACLGIEGGELMAMLQFAMLGQLAYPAIESAVIAHPSLAESLTLLFDYWQD